MENLTINLSEISNLNHHQVIVLLLQISIMLIFARLLSEFAKKFKQPAVVGEILAGIILGPTVIGSIYPEFTEWLFPQEGLSSFGLNVFITVSAVLLLFIAGLEVELPVVINQGKKALYTSVMGIAFGFALGFSVSQAFPEFFGVEPEKQFIFSLFLGIGISVSALAVTARNLMDLGVFKTGLGMVIIASAMLDDFIGWIIFSIILGLSESSGSAWNVVMLFISTLIFVALMLTVGKRLIDMILPVINKYLSFPGGILSFAIAVCFLGAAVTEAIGIHAVFGAFIVGVALGDSIHMTTKTKEIIHDFVNNIFAPLFFVSIGLKTNFILYFDPYIFLVILALAFIGKALGSGLGATFGGFNRKESLVVSFGMNARGSVDVLFATLALGVGFINEQVFVALVLMALTTSMASGYLVKYLMRSIMPRKRAGSNGKENAEDNEPNGIILYGGNLLSYFIAKYLQEQKIPVLIVDPVKENLAIAKQENISYYEGDLLDENDFKTLDLSAYGQICALTDNPDLNVAVSKIFAKEFGENKVFRLISKKEAQSASLALPKNLLFRGYWYFNYLKRLIKKEPAIRQIRMDSEEGLNNFIYINKKRIVPLLIHRPNRRVEPISSYPMQVNDGDILVYFDVKKEEKEQRKRQRVVKQES